LRVRDEAKHFSLTRAEPHEAAGLLPCPEATSPTLLGHCPEFEEAFARSVELAESRVPAPQRTQGAGQRNPSATHFKGKPRVRVQTDRVLERLTRGLPVTRCGVGAAVGLPRRSEQRVGAGSISDRAQLPRCRHRLLGMAGLTVRLGEELERWGPLDHRGAKQAQIASCPIHSSRYVAALERQRRAAQDRDWMVLRLLGQAQRLIAPTLAPAQFPKARERVHPLTWGLCQYR
jgi:hypothetical protein